MNKTDTKPEATLQRYWNPQGGGVEPHDAGLLYLRDDVDAMIAALRAERDALRAGVERLAASAKKLAEALEMLRGEEFWPQRAEDALREWEASNG